MGDAERNTAPDPGTFGSGLSAQGDQRSWTPMIMGAVVVVVVVAIIVWVTHNSSGSGALNQADPYIARLRISNLHMATAENFAGGAVTYIEGKLVNSGDKKVTAARVELVFKNSLGEVSQKEPNLPVMVLLPNSPYVDYGPIDRTPLSPGQTTDFRLTIEHVTADWDGQIPQIRVVGVSTS